MNWIKSTIAWIVRQFGIKPTINEALDYLKGQAQKTEMLYDDMGVAVLRAGVNAPSYELYVLLEEMGAEGVEQSLKTQNKIDDNLFFILREIGKAKNLSMGTITFTFIKALKEYATSTETEIDDKAVELIETILKETKVI